LQVLFDYCPTEALDFDYRCQLLLQELLGYEVCSSSASLACTWPALAVWACAPP